MSHPHAFVCPGASHFRRLMAALFCLTLLLAFAAAQESATVPNSAVPNLVKFSGTISGASAGSVGVIFALYAEQTGGAPLWQEVQNVTADPSGHYTSLLGSTTATGIPIDVFSSNQARWLGVQVQGQPEQTRILLVSVPYALKAADSQTLGGLPPSAFLRADAATTTTAPSTTAYVNTAAVSSAVGRAVAAAVSINGTATAGTLPVFADGSGNLTNSLITQVSLAAGGPGNFVGINIPASYTAGPATPLDIVGTNPTLRIDNYSNTIGDSPNFNFISGRGTSAAPLATQSGDNLGQFAAAGFNGLVFPGSKVKITFVATDPWSTADNGTAISFQTTTNGTTARTPRLFIDNTGNVGIGSIYGVPANGGTAPPYPLTVGGIIQSTSGGFRFPDGSMLTTATTVPNTGTGNTFTGNQTINGSATVSGSETVGGSQTIGGTETVSGIVYADKDVYVDVNHANNGTALSPGLEFAGAGTGEGIASNRNSGVNQYGLDFYTNRAKHMSITNGGQVGIGTQTPTAALEVDNGSENTSIYGDTYGRSATGNGYAGTISGVWGDDGDTSYTGGEGVLGTADDNFAGYFINNSIDGIEALWAESDESNNSKAPIFEVIGGHFGGGCFMDVSGDLVCTGTVSPAVTVASSVAGAPARQVALYAVQSPENWFEDFGSAALSGGAVTVSLEPTFTQTVNTGTEYHVFLTPNGDCKGLYVANKSAGSFEVRELGGGQSSVAFDYRIVAKRAGFENVRMEDLTAQFKNQAERRKKVHQKAISHN